jgi:hypothetical protein
VWAVVEAKRSQLQVVHEEDISVESAVEARAAVAASSTATRSTRLKQRRWLLNKGIVGLCALDIGIHRTIPNTYGFGEWRKKDVELAMASRLHMTVVCAHLSRWPLLTGVPHSSCPGFQHTSECLYWMYILSYNEIYPLQQFAIR